MGDDPRALRAASPTDACDSSRFSDQELREAFALFDVDSSGSIDQNEMRLLLSGLGIQFTAESFDEWYASIDADHNGKITYEEFAGCLKANAHRPNSKEEAYRVFKMFDTDCGKMEHGQGVLTADRLHAAVKQFDATASMAEVEEVVKYCGSDGSGITLDDWMRVNDAVAEMPDRVRHKFGCA
eukprot:TRINITY_DN7954_c0_g1_i1.p1 TRINITY_DN7954_c0_g1~~TRINITY_DN7954_c0_g1_i1.p1  ORF type:complete len:211 (+),score=100.10 TRINITY_DN7954_c0_g1_i1:86-634(+)